MSMGIVGPAPAPHQQVSTREAIANWTGALSLIAFVVGIVMIGLGTLYHHETSTDAFANQLAYGGVGLAAASLVVMVTSAYVLLRRAIPYFSPDAKQAFLLLLIGAVGGLLMGASSGFNQTDSAMNWTGVAMVSFSGLTLLSSGLIKLAHEYTKRNNAVNRVGAGAGVSL